MSGLSVWANRGSTEQKCLEDSFIQYSFIFFSTVELPSAPCTWLSHAIVPPFLHHRHTNVLLFFEHPTSFPPGIYVILFPTVADEVKWGKWLGRECFRRSVVRFPSSVMSWLSRIHPPKSQGLHPGELSPCPGQPSNGVLRNTGKIGNQGAYLTRTSSDTIIWFFFKLGRKYLWSHGLRSSQRWREKWPCRAFMEACSREGPARGRCSQAPKGCLTLFFKFTAS